MTSKLEEIEAKLVEQRRFFEDLRVQIVNTHTTVIANALNKQIISEAIAELHAYEQTHPKEGANTKRLDIIMSNSNYIFYRNRLQCI